MAETFSLRIYNEFPDCPDIFYFFSNHQTSEANPRTVICPSLRDLVPQLPEERDFALFGIFDGHGGKQVGDWGIGMKQRQAEFS